MNQQDMQFRSQQDREEEPYAARPINDGPREQRWQGVGVSEQKETYDGYAGFQLGYPDATSLEGEKLRPRSSQRRRPRIWLWVGAVVLLCLLFGSVSGYLTSKASVPYSHVFPQMAQKFAGDNNDGRELKAHEFSVGAQPTLDIQNENGNVFIQSDANVQTISITPITRTTQESTADVTYDIGVNGAIEVKAQGNIGAVDSGRDVVDFKVVVPSTVDLHVHTNAGDINVVGVNGQMNLDTKGGTINVTDSTLVGKGTLQVEGGALIINAALAPGAYYMGLVMNGKIDATLPKNGSFHIDVQGPAIQSDFPEVKVDKDTSGSGNNVAHGDVNGNTSNSSLDLEVSGNGGIYIGNSSGN